MAFFRFVKGSTFKLFNRHFSSEKIIKSAENLIPTPNEENPSGFSNHTTEIPALKSPENLQNKNLPFQTEPQASPVIQLIHETLKEPSDPELNAEINLTWLLISKKQILDNNKIVTLLSKLSNFKLDNNQTSILVMKILFHLQKSPTFSRKTENTLFSLCKKVTKNSLSKFDLVLIKEMVKVYAKFPVEKIKTFEGKNLLKFCQQIILRRLQNFTPQETKIYSEILSISLFNKIGMDAFISGLEGIIFTNLKELTNVEIHDLFINYSNRLIKDHEYIIYNINKPVVEIIIERFETIEYELLISMIFLLSKTMVIYGAYYDERLGQKIEKMLVNTNFMNSHEYLRQKLCMTFLDYSSYLGFLNDHLVSLIFTNISKSLNFFSPWLLINYGFYFSRFDKIPDFFWNILYKKLPDLESLNFTHRSMINTMLINLKESNPAMQALIYKKFTEEGLEKNRQRLQKIWIESVSKSYEHTIAEKALTKLGIKFESEFFDNFLIDIAIPEKKIAFEISGPHHYIWPEGTLRGNTLLKKKILEGLKWKVFIIKFNPANTSIELENIYIEIFKNILKDFE